VKKKGILGVALTLMLLGSLMAAAAPVSGATLDWSSVTLPTTTNKILQPGTDVLDFAIAGDEETIYAAAPFASTATLRPGSEWSATQKVSGVSSAKVVFTGTHTYVEFTPASGTTLSDLEALSTAWGFWYHLNATAGGPQLELKFTSGTDFLDITFMTLQSGVTINTLKEEVLSATSTTVGYYGTYAGSAAFNYAVANKTLADALAHLKTTGTGLGADQPARDAAWLIVAGWELTNVRVELYADVVAARDCYIDDVTIDGAIYNLEGVATADGTALAGNLFKSTDAGASWSGVTIPSVSVNLVAVAPDDADIVAYVEGTAVFFTTNGGSTWGSLAEITGCTEIRDIAISAEKVGKHYIAVAGVDSGSGTGNAGANVWYYNYGDASPAWNPTNTLAGFNTTSTTESASADVAAAVEFSPNFTSDEVMVALLEAEGAAPTDTDNITLGMFSFDSDAWNAAAGFTDWPADVVLEVDIEGLTNGSITLDPDYLGSDDAMRMAFVGLYIDSAAAANGIYRVDDVLVKAIKEGASVDINSVAYNGLNLVAGEVGSNTTYYCSDPTTTTPTVTASSSYKRPGGQTNVIVAWAGADVAAATSGDESAFAVSTNDGRAYNDISLIDTALTNLSDVAVSPDGETVFLATDDGEDLSLWHETSSWERVLSVQDKEDFIIRIAPDAADVVYMAEKGASTIYYSADSGETRWQLRTCGVSIQDLAVETGGDVSYALDGDDGKVSRSTNSGFTWGSPEDTKLTGGNMIVSLGEDELMVGSDDSYVAYSADGNESWTKIAKPVVSGGEEVQCIASGVADDDYIYAAAKAADYIYRWQIGVSSVWKKIYTSAVTGNVTGMNLQGNVLYAMATDGANSVAYRTTNATLFPTVYWSTMASTAVFGITPQSLKVGGGGSNQLWAIDTEGDDLYSYTDTLIDVAPTLNSPKQDFGVKINPVTGKSTQVTFNWERPSDEVTAYELKIAFDAGFDEEVASITVSESGTPISQIVGPGKVLFFETPASTETSRVYVTGEIEFMPDTTYFWRVRVSSPIKSQYSEVRRFTVEKSTVTPPVIVEIPPAPPTPQITVTVPPPTKVEIPPAPPAPAPITPAYIWAIIIIGAILVIALVILIVRTRRVV